jgi:hypothetical protein
MALGLYGKGMDAYLRDELELGSRVAIRLDIEEIYGSRAVMEDDFCFLVPHQAARRVCSPIIWL